MIDRRRPQDNRKYRVMKALQDHYTLIMSIDPEDYDALVLRMTELLNDLGKLSLEFGIEDMKEFNMDLPDQETLTVIIGSILAVAFGMKGWTWWQKNRPKVAMPANPERTIYSESATPAQLDECCPEACDKFKYQCLRDGCTPYEARGLFIADLQKQLKDHDKPSE